MCVCVNAQQPLQNVNYLVSNMELIYKLVFLMVTLVLGDKAFFFELSKLMRYQHVGANFF